MMTTPTSSAAITPRLRSFDTAMLPLETQIERWEHHNAARLVPLRIHPTGSGGLLATETNLELDTLRLARVRAQAHRVERGAEIIERSPGGAIAAYLTVRGDAVMEHHGHRRVLRPGDLLICDVDRPIVRGFGHGLDELVVSLPREEFRAMTGIDRLEQPIIVPAGADPLATELGSLVARGTHAQRPMPPDPLAVRALIAALAGGDRLGHGAGHRARALAHIDRNFTDPSLSAARIAESIGVSERHVSRLFAGADSSVPRHILRRRLDAAHFLLTTTAVATTREVAERCGFTSPTTFANAFRARFGVRAGELRRSGPRAA